MSLSSAPSWIKSSEHYKNMFSDEDSDTENENTAENKVPTKYLNFNLNMKTEESYFRVINMLGYWQVTDIPFSVLDSIRDNILDISDNVYYLMILQYIHLDVDSMVRYSIDNKNQNLYNYTYTLQEKNFGKPYVPLASKVLEIKYLILKFVEEDMGILSFPNLDVDEIKTLTDGYLVGNLLLIKLNTNFNRYYDDEDLSKKDIKKIVNAFNVSNNYIFVKFNETRNANSFFYIRGFWALCDEFGMEQLGTDKIEYDDITKTLMYTQTARVYN